MRPFDYEKDLASMALELPEEVRYYKYSGDFPGERAAIAHYRATHYVPEELQRRLDMEDMIAEALQDDYRMSDEMMIEAIRETYPHFDAKALQTCIDMGHANWILKDGRRYFQNSAKSNIRNCCYAYLRSLEGIETTPGVDEDDENAKYMKEHGQQAYRFRVRMTLWPEKEYERPGKTLRLFFPYPNECEEQSEITLLDSSDPVIIEKADQRTAYMEVPCVPGKKYWVEFSFVNRSVYRTFRAEDALPAEQQPTFETEEILPHIRFTPYLRALAKEIAGEETNPLLKAHRVYDWITTNVHYTYLRDYLLLDNIAENTALSGQGDCGVQTMLFITLCRILGIPAVWQSGMAARPDHVGSHDWAKFYVAPFGWLYADPAYGGGLRKNYPEACEYFFGNLDCFRFVTCNAMQKQFVPAKRFVRCDPYDCQCGEMEYEDENLFFGQYDWSREVIAAEEVK